MGSTECSIPNQANGNALQLYPSQAATTPLLWDGLILANLPCD